MKKKIDCAQFVVAEELVVPADCEFRPSGNPVSLQTGTERASFAGP